MDIEQSKAFIASLGFPSFKQVPQNKKMLICLPKVSPVESIACESDLPP